MEKGNADHILYLSYRQKNPLKKYSLSPKPNLLP